MKRLILLCMAPMVAHAQQNLTVYSGQPVASVQLIAGEGELPDDDLQPLLRATQNEPLRPGDVQLDVATLYRVGEFAAVEAEIDEWFVIDAETGEPIEAVQLRYVVYPAARIERVRVQGVDRLTTRDIVYAARIGEGDVFYPKLDTERVQERVRSWMVGAGFPQANVSLKTIKADDDPFSLEIVLTVDEGNARLLNDLTIVGLPDDLSLCAAKRWMRQAGLRRRKPISEAALTRARYTLRQHMANLGNGRLDNLVGPKTADLLCLSSGTGGWAEARVRVRTEPYGADLNVNIDVQAGRRLVLQTSGISETQARDALGIDARLRLTGGFIAEAPDKIEQALERDGFRDAVATVDRRIQSDNQVLDIVVQRGPRYRRGRIRFEGNDALRDNQLRTVLYQASPDVLRQRRLTDPELAKALNAAEQVMRSVGYELATITPRPVVTRRRLPRLPFRIGQLHHPFTRWIDVTIDVVQGPLTTLTRLEVIDAAPDVDMSSVRTIVDRLQGGPWSPQALRSLSLHIVELHRRAGYLNAEARVVSTNTDDTSVHSRLLVKAGPLVLLRSFATRGNRRVSSGFLRQHVGPEVGRPLTTETLEQIRERLYDLGMFSSLELSLIGDGPARDLIVNLRERPRHTVEGGVGVATDQGVRVLGRWTVRNLAGAADRADTNVLIGLPFSNRLRSLDEPEYRLSTTYTTPLSRSSDLALALIVQEETQERNWRIQSRGASARWVMRPRKQTQLQAGAAMRVRRLLDADPGAVLVNDVWNNKAMTQDGTEPQPDRSLSTRFRAVDELTLVWVEDHRDNPLQPTRGVLWNSRVEFSPNLVQPSYARDLRVPMLTAEARLAAIVPLGPARLHINAEGGHQRVLHIGPVPSFTLADDTTIGPAVPVEDRYRLGGTASLRGFRREGVGPKDLAPPLALDWSDKLKPLIDWGNPQARDVATGGDTYGLGSVDLLIPLPSLGLSDWDGYELALFADVGQTWFVDPNTPVNSLDEDVPFLRWSTGVGLRVVTPVGPLQADLALNPQATFSKGARQALLRERWEEARLRMHLSLGTLF
ncbi:MAG: outer membrane protein insertion porin family [Kiritimatiellia bacterium]